MANTFYKLDNYVIIDLYEIELENNEGYLRFHGSKNFDRNIVFNGNDYLFIPCEFSNLEKATTGKQSRPTIKISNINYFISRVLADRKDLISKVFYRKRVLARDLSSSNFIDGINPFGKQVSETYISLERLIINRKISENKEMVELELVTPIDLETITVPGRKVTNDTCSWGYRCYGCNYGNKPDYAGPTIGKNTSLSYFSSGVNLGVPIADENDKTFVAGYHTDISSKSYNLSTIQYKGLYSSSTTYSQGDFIYIDNLAGTDFTSSQSVFESLNKPKRFFVYISSTSSSNKYPDQNTDVWKEDKCSRTLKGCLLRFKDYNDTTVQKSSTTSPKTLPFGAFPATFPYENQSPT
jgi:lambda family phage minor tail protein L